MKHIEIELTNKQMREWDYYLSRRYGKGKFLKNKFKMAIMEIVSRQGSEELEKLKKALNMKGTKL